MGQLDALQYFLRHIELSVARPQIQSGFVLPMEIGTAAEQQTVFPGQRPNLALVAGPICAVQSLNAHQPDLFQLSHQGIQPGIAHMAENGMGQNGYALCSQNQRYGLGGRNLFPGHIIGTMVAHIALESLRPAPHISMLQHILGIMSPGDHRTGKSGAQFFIGDIHSSLPQALAHLIVAGVPRGHEVLQISLETGVPVINVQAYHMYVPALIITGEFDAGDDLRHIVCVGPSQLCGIVQGLFQAVYRVVVRQREGGQAFFSGIIHQPGRGVSPIGTGGMHMQIDHDFAPFL